MKVKPMKARADKVSAEEVLKRLKGLQLDQSQRQVMLERHFYMYGHSTLNNTPFEFGKERVRVNIVQSCVDTLLNKVTKNLPRATFLTDDGDWSNQEKAKKREKFVYGQFYKSEVYQKTPMAALQALCYGDGYIKTFASGKELKVEPRLTPTIVVDERETIPGGAPRTYFEIGFSDKDTLCELYPEHSEKIKKLPTAIMPFYMYGPVQHNLVELVEYWHLPVNDENPGVHMIIAGDGLELVNEDYKSRRPPVRKLSFVKNLIGWYSKGVAEVVTPYQIEANRTLKRISDSLRLVASPKVFYEYGSKIVQAHFNNDVGAMIGYQGTPPQFHMPQAIGTELFNHLGWCIQAAYQDVGISQLSANSMKPAGLNSGKALREYNDIETERFAGFAKAWEQFHVQIAEDCLEVAKEIVEKHGTYSVLSPDPKGCEIIDFKDIDMDKDKYLIQTYPTSSLPKDPAGRLEYVSELMAAQLLSPEEAISLLDFPDTMAITAFKRSTLEDIKATVDYMLTKDKYLPPEPFQDLELGIQMMKSAYLMYKNKGCPDSKLDLLYRWVNDALVMLTPPQDPVMTGDELTPPTEGEMIEDVPMDEPVIDPLSQTIDGTAPELLPEEMPVS
jgi:hypothetical protein